MSYNIKPNVLMINDIVYNSKEQIVRVIAINKNIITTSDNEKIKNYDIKPVELTHEYIINNKILDICQYNNITIDFSRRYKLKVSIVDFIAGKTIISYFYPKPKYIHELQHILRNFNEIEI